MARPFAEQTVPLAALAPLRASVEQAQGLYARQCTRCGLLLAGCCRWFVVVVGFRSSPSRGRPGCVIVGLAGVRPYAGVAYAVV